MVSGSLARITASMALFCTSISGSRSRVQSSSMSNGPSMRASAAERGGADQLVGVLQLLLQGARHFRLREARQDIDDVQARDRVLAVQASDQLGQIVVGGQLAQDAEQRGLFVGFLLVGGGQQFAHRQAAAMRGDHVEQRGLGDALGVQRIEQHGRRIRAAAGERPGHARNHARAARDHGFDEFGEGLLVDQAGQHFDIGDRRDLVGVSQRRRDGFDGAGPELAQLGDGLLGLRSGDVGRFFELRDEPVSPDVGEKTHGTDELRPARRERVRCASAERSKPAVLCSLNPITKIMPYVPIDIRRSGP